MRKILLIAFLIFTANSLLASDILFEQANKYYTEEKYEDAITLYDSIQQSGLQSTELFYNMGNAYYKLQYWPNCILYYEKTLKLDANNEDAKYNLELAQLKIVDKIEGIPLLFFERWINNILSFFSFDTWAVFCVIFLWLGFVMFCVIKLIRIQLTKQLFVILMISSFITFVFAKNQFGHKTQQKSAIIFSSAVVIKSAPSFSANDLFSLHAGSKISITDQIGNWIHIQLPNGNKGWMLKEACKEI